MKKNNKIFLGALCLAFAAASLYAAPKTKDIYVSPEANGTLLTTDGEGLASLDLDKPVDFAGYKYVIYECSSPDGAKIANLYINTYYGEENENHNAPKSSTVCIGDISKKISAYQTFVYGAVNKCYDYGYVDGKCDIRPADKTICERLGVAVADKDWNWLPGIKIYIKKVTATNEPLGKVVTVDLTKVRFTAANDGDNSYYCHIPLSDILSAKPQKGDVIKFALKGNNVYGINTLQSSVTEEVKGGYAYRPVSQSVQIGDIPAGAIDVPVEFVLSKNVSNIRLEFDAYKGDNDGPFLILFE